MKTFTYTEEMLNAELEDRFGEYFEMSGVMYPDILISLLKQMLVQEKNMGIYYRARIHGNEGKKCLDQ